MSYVPTHRTFFTPLVGIQILKQVFSYGFVESFAGNAEATKQVAAMWPGQQCVTMDVLQCAALDVNKNGGFGILSSIRWNLGPCHTLCFSCGS